MGSGVAMSDGFGSIYNPAHSRLVFRGQFHIPRSPVLFQSFGLRCSGNCNHALSGYPSKRNLADVTAFAGREFLDLLHDSLIFVEIFALEFRSCRSFSILLKLKGLYHEHVRRKSPGVKSSGEL